MFTVTPQTLVKHKNYANTLDTPLHPNMPPMLPNRNGFAMALSGAAGSGKTTLLYNLTCRRPRKGVPQGFRGLFDLVLVVSPTIGHGSMKSDEFCNLPDDQRYDVLDLDTLKQLEERIRANHDEKKNTLLILDDVGMQLKGKNDKLLSQFVLNRRHVGLSIIVLVQKWNTIPTSIRANLSHVVLFRPKTLKERTSIVDELFDIPRGKVDELFRFVYEDSELDKYSFLLVDMSLVHSSKFLYYKGFDRIEGV
jgi:hypothetical protein